MPKNLSVFEENPIFLDAGRGRKSKYTPHPKGGWQGGGKGRGQPHLRKGNRSDRSQMRFRVVLRQDHIEENVFSFTVAISLKAFTYTPSMGVEVIFCDHRPPNPQGTFEIPHKTV